MLLSYFPFYFPFLALLVIKKHTYENILKDQIAAGVQASLVHNQAAADPPTLAYKSPTSEARIWSADSVVIIFFLFLLK